MSGKGDHLTRLWRHFKGCCHWCSRPTRLLPRIAKRKHHPPDMATRDHLLSRLNPRRYEPMRRQEYRVVLACRDCNQRRARHEELLVGLMMVLHARLRSLS